MLYSDGRGGGEGRGEEGSVERRERVRKGD